MTVERIIHIVAGFMVLIGLSLGLLVSPWWFCLSAFVGLNLFQYGITQFCPLELILRKCNVPTRTEKETANAV
jgi:hypothetical protein